MQNSSTEEDEWLIRAEVCDLLHVTPTTLWREENEVWKSGVFLIFLLCFCGKCVILRRIWRKPRPRHIEVKKRYAYLEVGNVGNSRLYKRDGIVVLTR